MDDLDLTYDDLLKIKDSLIYSKLHFENYVYPSYEQKAIKIKEIETVLAKVNNILRLYKNQ